MGVWIFFKGQRKPWTQTKGGPCPLVFLLNTSCCEYNAMYLYINITNVFETKQKHNITEWKMSH